MGPPSFVAMQAAEFARKKHEKQVRKYNGEPYFNHLEEVAEIMRAFNLGEEAETLAYLHDTVEDTDTTHKELVDAFGVQIALGVRALTNEKHVGNRKQRKALDRNRLSLAPAIVQSVKCGDMISNARDIVGPDPNFAIVFLDEMDELLKVLRLADKNVLQFANMVCQVEQLYLHLNNARKAKGNGNVNTTPQNSSDSVPASGATAA